MATFRLRKPGGGSALRGEDTLRGPDAEEKSVSDSGSGADTATLVADRTEADSGAGADTAILDVEQTVADAGTGAEGTPVIDIADPITDQGTGAETATLEQIEDKGPVSDTGAGSDEVVGPDIAASDQGTGAEAATLEADQQAADQGAGADTGLVEPQLPGDSGAGSEAATLEADVPAADAGAGAETLSVDRDALADTGAGTDAVTQEEVFIGKRDVPVRGRRTRKVFEVSTPEGTHHPVVAGYSDDEEAPGGQISATGEIAAADVEAHPEVYRYGATWITRDATTGAPLFGGTLLPVNPVGGQAHVTVRGWGTLAERTVERLLYASDDLSEWAAADQAPYNYSSSPEMEARVAGRRIVFRVRKGTVFRRNQAGNPADWTAAVLRWFPDTDLHSIRFTIRKERDATPYELRLLGATGPDGALTVLQTWALDATTPDSTEVDVAITGGHDLLMLQFRRTSERKNSRSFRAWVTDLRVRGIATDDSFTAGDFNRDVAARLGASPAGILDSPTEILPLEVQEGSYGEPLTEVALYDDFRWLLLETGSGRAVLDVGPWETREWTVPDPEADFDPVSVTPYNAVRVPFRYPGGQRGWVTVWADPNPLPPGVENVRDIELDDPLPPQEVSRVFGEAIIGYLATERVAGRLEASELLDSRGVRAPAHLAHAGDIIRLPHHGGLRLRVKRQHRMDATVTWDFDDGHALLDWLLARRRRLLAMGRANAAATLSDVTPARPAAPANVALTFKVRETAHELKYRGVVNWDAVTDDEEGNPTAVHRYIVQLRPTDATGNPRDEEGNPIPPSTEKALIHKAVVDEKDDEGDLDDLPTRYVFRDIDHPADWHYQARVRSVDIRNRKGPWSAWTAVQLPANTAEPKPPTPGNVTLAFDNKVRHRHLRFRAIVRCDEVPPFDYPGGDKNNDVVWYQFQIERTDSAGTPILTDDLKRVRRKKLVPWEDEADDENNVAKATFFPIRKRHYWRARVRSIDRFGRKGDWSLWTAHGTPSDSDAPPAPTSVTLTVRQRHFIAEVTLPTDPDDPEPDSGLKDPHPDIAFWQCQVATDSFFTNVIRSDRKVLGDRKQFKANKPGDATYYARARTMDAAGNASAWVSASDAKGRPSSPSVTGIVFDTTEKTKGARVRATVNFSQVTDLEEDIDRYVVQFQTNNSSTFTADQKRRRAVVDEFEPGDTDDQLSANFGQIKRHRWCRARVRAVTKDGQKSTWSPWSTPVQATDSEAPPAPSGVTVTSIPKGVAVDWSDAVDDLIADTAHRDVTHYEVELHGNSLFTNLIKRRRHETGTRKEFKGPAVTEGGTYYARVRSVASEGTKSGWVTSTGHVSAPVVDTPAIVPGAVTPGTVADDFPNLESVVPNTKDLGLIQAGTFKTSSGFPRAEMTDGFSGELRIYDSAGNLSKIRSELNYLFLDHAFVKVGNNPGGAVGFFGGAGAPKQSFTKLTDNTGAGSAGYDGIIGAVSGSGADAAINNNFADLLTAVNRLADRIGAYQLLNVT